VIKLLSSVFKLTPFNNKNHSEFEIANTGAVDRTITLSENQPAGTMRTIKKIDNGIGNVLVARTGADNIDGAAGNRILYYQNEAITCVSNGADWFII
jgi:hypothetical protein